MAFGGGASVTQEIGNQLDGKMRRFTPHDLRFTARSRVAALEVHVIVAGGCLNHGGLIAFMSSTTTYADGHSATISTASFGAAPWVCWWA